MPLFSTLAALSQTAASNPPDGTVDAPSTIDDQLRLLGSFIAQLRDGTGFTGGAVVPTGTILDYGGSVAPTGFIFCDGAARSRTTDAALFAVIGTTYGAGDGSTTFNAPDFRGRTTIGAGTGSGLTARTLGTQNIGEETHVLTAAENGPHAHTVTVTVSDPPHGHTANNGAITHRLLVSDGLGGMKSGTDPAANGLAAAGGTASGYLTSPGGTATALVESTATAVSVNTAATGVTATATAASSGSGAAHNNMQPSAVVNKIIKT